MPRIKRVAESPQYREVSTQAREALEARDCAPKALALITGLPFEAVNAALIKAGRKPRKGTPWDATHEALSMLGYRLEPLGHDFMRAIINSYPPRHRTLQSITTHHPRRFPRVWRDVEPLLFDTGSHVAAFKDGVLHDWSCNRALRVNQLYRLVKVDEPLTTAQEPPPKATVSQEPPPYHSPAALGAYDFQRGHTACPFGDAPRATLWRQGYKEASQ